MWYPMILLADSEGPDQGLRCPHMYEDTFSRGAAWIISHLTLNWFTTWKQGEGSTTRVQIGNILIE